MFEIFEFLVQCLSPLGALVPNIEKVWARARAEEAVVASQTHRALFTFVAKFCLTALAKWSDNDSREKEWLPLARRSPHALLFQGESQQQSPSKLHGLQNPDEFVEEWSGRRQYCSSKK